MSRSARPRCSRPSGAVIAWLCALATAVPGGCEPAAQQIERAPGHAPSPAAPSPSPVARAASPPTTAQPAPVALDHATRRALVARSARTFAGGELLRPPADADLDGGGRVPATPLAPLLLLETVPELGAARASPHAATDDPTHGRTLDDSDEPSPSAAPLRVGLSESMVDWLGQPLRQLAFAWQAQAGGPGDGDSPRLQGLRITLGRDGFPLLFEVLRDSSGARVLFVGRALEELAAAAHGAPLPGRRYACERAVEDAPRVVVAGLVERGPMPLGPFVYLDREQHDVTTVLCRCAPSQVGGVLESRPYELVPLDALAHARAGEPEGPGPGLGLDALPLEALLRWPSVLP